MFILWPFLYLYIKSHSPLLHYFIIKSQEIQYTKYTNIYVNFIILLCRLTIDFVGVGRYNKDTIRQEHEGGNSNGMAHH